MEQCNVMKNGDTHTYTQKMCNSVLEERVISTTGFPSSLVSPCTHSVVNNLFAQETKKNVSLSWQRGVIVVYRDMKDWKIFFFGVFVCF